MAKSKRIVITGYGIASCFGSDRRYFYEQLLAGRSGVKKITQFELGDLPTHFAAQVEGINPEEFMEKKLARRADRCISNAISAGKMAIAHARLDPKSVDPKRAGVLVGSGMGGVTTFTDGVCAYAAGGYRKVTPFFIPFIIPNMPSGLLAVELGFKGPNYSISTACATSNYSVKAAADHIFAGHADIMLAGGMEAPINPVCIAGFSSMRALSRNNDNMEEASRPWDKARDGFVMGDGGGVFVLETLEHALARGAPILAEYCGGAMTCDAHHMTEPTPDGSDVAECIELALADGGLKPGDVDYINAHATSTPVGDLCEVRAVKKIFGPYLRKIKMNATKSMIGHALGGAGALELAVIIEAIQTGMVHPTINLVDAEEELDGIDVVPCYAQKHSVNVAISNSFGFGGHNCVLAVKRYNG